jgi:hypothetical protein
MVDPDTFLASSSEICDVARSEFIPVRDVRVHFTDLDSTVESFHV